MSVQNYSENFKLPLFSGTDLGTWADIANAMSKIEVALTSIKKNSDDNSTLIGTKSLNTTADNLSEAINELKSAIGSGILNNDKNITATLNSLLALIGSDEFGGTTIIESLNNLINNSNSKELETIVPFDSSVMSVSDCLSTIDSKFSAAGNLNAKSFVIQNGMIVGLVCSPPFESSATRLVVQLQKSGTMLQSSGYIPILTIVDTSGRLDSLVTSGLYHPFTLQGKLNYSFDGSKWIGDTRETRFIMKKTATNTYQLAFNLLDRVPNMGDLNYLYIGSCSWYL